MTRVPLAFALLGASLSAQTVSSELVASGFSSPVYATAAPGDWERIFVVQKSGAIRVIRNGSVLSTPFLSLSVATNAGERGLLGLAFHPDYQSNGYFYVNYSRTTDGATMVERFQVSSNADVASLASRTLMLGPISQPYSNHNGGCIQFGPDGYLYVAMGDGGGGDPGCRAQSGSSLLGKFLRLDVDTNPSGPAVAPATNPFVGNASFNDLIWSYGWRNPWRFSFDRVTGDMWIGDVGQNALEEIDFEPAGAGGRNYGWKIMEGTNCYSTGGCTNPPTCNAPTLERPVRTLPTSSNCAVIGGYVYRGCAIPSLQGTYFHGDYCSGRIWSFEFVGGAVTNLVDRTSQLGGSGAVSSFGEDANGEILYCQGSSVRRIVPTGSITNTVAGPGSVGSNGAVPVYEACGLFGAGNEVTFQVRNAPANAPAAVLFGAQSNPVSLPFPGFGSLVPVPVAFSLGLGTDGDGVASFQVPGTGMVFDLYHQVVIADLALGGVTLSNALRTFFNAGPPPTISSIVPLSASAGTTVRIIGTNFAPSLVLTIDGNPVTPSAVASTSIDFAYPAGTSCDAPVVVTNPDTQSVSSTLNPTPVVTNPFNPTGPAAGGQQWIIIGSGFSPGTSVTIGGAAALVTQASGSVLIVITPSGTVGVQPVMITTPGGCSTTTVYTYT